MANLSQVAKECLNGNVLQEWDVTRRTAEFFDEQIGKLRELAFTVSTALIGIAFQFKIRELLLLVPLLEIGFILIDFRYQEYLNIVSSYASDIEARYRFAFEGLTQRIKAKRGRSLRWYIMTLYVAYILICTFLYIYLTYF